MVGGHLQGGDALGLHLTQEVHQVAAIGLDRVVGQQGVADPGDQRRGGAVGVIAHRLEGAGDEGLDLVGGRAVARKKVTALRHQGRAGQGG